MLIKALGQNILPSSPFASTLEREARLLSELDHPGIVKVHDFVKRGDRMWLVLEHVDGVTLEELLNRAKRLSEAAALAIGLRLTEALAHAHEHSVVHRDLSSKNVFISKRGEVKLLNFALAVDERMPTAPELLDGSTGYLGPVYMSPEQILGEPADPRSDSFSVGVILYELLSGVRPFEGPERSLHVAAHSAERAAAAHARWRQGERQRRTADRALPRKVAERSHQQRGRARRRAAASIG